MNDTQYATENNKRKGEVAVRCGHYSIEGDQECLFAKLIFEKIKEGREEPRKYLGMLLGKGNI